MKSHPKFCTLLPPPSETTMRMVIYKLNLHKQCIIKYCKVFALFLIHNPNGSMYMLHKY
jgi:hypothetical protein